MNAAIRNVNLDLTTFCDRACPNCCAATNGKLFRPQVHHDWAYFERAAKVLYGIERVLLCGGEPTYHPAFAAFVPRFKALFGCQVLAMVTDGWGVERYCDTIDQWIDEIDFTDYHTGRLGYMNNYVATLVDVRVFDAGRRMENFTPRSRVGGGNPCERAWWRSGTVAYADGKVYGCCVAPGIEGATGVEFEDPILSCDDRAIPTVPCAICFFSE
jgi:hypothetical protein